MEIALNRRKASLDDIVEKPVELVINMAMAKTFLHLAVNDFLFNPTGDAHQWFQSTYYDNTATTHISFSGVCEILDISSDKLLFRLHGFMDNGKKRLVESEWEKLLQDISGV